MSKSKIFCKQVLKAELDINMSRWQNMSPQAEEMIGPNFDLGRHSSGIRLKSGSGVFIDAPPFSRQVRKVGEYESSNGRLIVFLWEPSLKSNS